MGLIAVTPTLRVREGLFTADELDQLHAVGSDWGLIGRLSRETSHGPTGFSWEIPRAAHPMVEVAARRMEAALGAPDALAAGGGGTLRFRRYARGEGHPPHLDVYAVGGLSRSRRRCSCSPAPARAGTRASRSPTAAPSRCRRRPGG